MNRRTFLATTPLALVPRVPDQKPPETGSSTDTDNGNKRDDDPLTLEDILITADVLPADWTPGSIEPGSPAHRDENQESTATGLISQTHPQTDERITSTYAKRRFIMDSDLPSELEHLDVALKVANTGEHTPHDNRGEAIRALHEVTFASETENWELTTEWAEVDLNPATNQPRRRSVAFMRKPLCAVPADLTLSTDKPLIETAVVVAPLPWGVAVVTGTLADPEKMGLTRRLVTRLADRVVGTGRATPSPLEARQ